MLDRKAINERRAALIAHICGCAVCRELTAIRVGQPTPDGCSHEAACVERNRTHFEEVGMVPTRDVIAEMDKVRSERIRQGGMLSMVDELPQGGYATHVRG